MSSGEQKLYWQVLDTYVGALRQSARFASLTGRSVLRPVVSFSELPNLFRPHISRRIQTTQPLSDAQIALAAIERGSHKHDMQLAEEGEALLVLAVERAVVDPSVPRG
jgi:hypothetical protein